MIGCVPIVVRETVTEQAPATSVQLVSTSVPSTIVTAPVAVDGSTAIESVTESPEVTAVALAETVVVVAVGAGMASASNVTVIVRFAVTFANVNWLPVSEASRPSTRTRATW